MIDVLKKENCCGCHACASICPKGCISMKQDEEGFLYPQVDKEKCINCGLCKKSCPILNNKKDEKFTPKTFACYNKDLKVRLNSSSGGVFSLLAEHVIKQNGIVFGAGFNKNFEVEHMFVEKKEDLDVLRMSKYVQSKIGDSFKQAKSFLETGRQVLFTGTPCQIEGLKTFLQKDYENLVTQDIVCHGVPSPAVWRKYLDNYKNNTGSQISKVEFRNKDKSWTNYSFVIGHNNGEIYKKKFTKETYMKMFIFNKILRPSCHACKFKKINRQSDITLADFWGIRSVAPELNDNKGTSLVVIHSEKGQKLFETIKENVVSKEVDFYKSIKRNPSYSKASRAHRQRPKLMQDLNRLPFEKLLKKYGKHFS